MLIKFPSYDQVALINTTSIVAFQVMDGYAQGIVMTTSQGERIDLALPETKLSMNEILVAIYDAHENGQRTLDLTDDGIKQLTL